MKRTKDLGAETIQWPSERYLTIGSDFAGKSGIVLSLPFFAKPEKKTES